MRRYFFPSLAHHKGSVGQGTEFILQRTGITLWLVIVKYNGVKVAGGVTDRRGAVDVLRNVRSQYDVVTLEA